MARPHPVVRVTAKLTYAARRGHNETYILVLVVDDDIVLITSVEGGYLDSVKGRLRVLLDDLLRDLLDGLLTLSLVGDTSDSLLDASGHVDLRTEVLDRESRDR